MKKINLIWIFMVLISLVGLNFVIGETAVGYISFTIEGGASSWQNLIAPEGIFEPTSSLSGTHINTFYTTFTGLTINPSEKLLCTIKTSDGTLVFANETNLTLNLGTYYLGYDVSSGDSIINDANSGYLPWVLKNCSIINSTGQIIFNETINKRVYVHNASYWEDGEITRAVACEGTPNVYFNNTGKCEFSEDTLFALQMRNGNKVNESCFNNAGTSCSDNYCRGIFFPTCDPISYFGGYSASSDDPNGYTNFTTSFSGYSTPIAYTYYTNGSGNFKLRILETLSSKTFTITLFNLTNVNSANVYGNETGGGITTITDNGDGTYNVAHNRLSSSFSGTLDFVFNISFNSPLDSNRTIKLVLGYGTETNQGNPVYFTGIFNPTQGLYNLHENETSAITTDFGGMCSDGVNNDFDYLNGIWDYSYDCFDSDCNGILGGNQTNEFGSDKSGLCNYNTELNCSDEYDNDYDSISGTDFTDCHDSDCFQNGGSCPSVELICNDEINNDWDYTKSENNYSSGERIENNGVKYAIGYKSNLLDCEDIDCNGSIGGLSGERCNWGYETNCSDGFNNDFLQLSDCELQTVSSTTLINPTYGEYDCSSYCRQTNSSETGSQCDDGLDNDYDAIIISGYYDDQYSQNTSLGSGIDCRWGGYFGYGTDYNPDEECNSTVLSNGKSCELGRELSCNDGFDNDYDLNASGMPNSNWQIDSVGYLNYFGTAFSSDSDYDDYDCQASAPSNESLNASWCFDLIDNDLDMYSFTSSWAPNTSTGRDCSDPDCLGVTNPANLSLTCLSKEYDPNDSFFSNLAYPGQYCDNGVDDDADGPIDCSDLDCYQQFDRCSLGPCYSSEDTLWNSCLDGNDNDYDGNVDCADSDCIGMLGNISGKFCGASEISCDDGFDNDANGLTDCEEHSVCDGLIGGTIDGVSVSCSASESSFSECFDGFDNDADGSLDCSDSGCSSFCNLSEVSGIGSITLPVNSGEISLNSVSDATIFYTSKIKNGEIYNITFKMTGSSSDAQWTLGTASGAKFNKSVFDNSSKYLSGPNAGAFSISETQNGFILSSNGANLPSGYVVSFIINSTKILSPTNYELTYAEASGSKTSLNNYPSYEIVENNLPSVNSLQISPNSSGIKIGESIYLKANVSEDSSFGECEWSISGPENFSPSASVNCEASFSPTIEGNYTINITPVDSNSNRGNVFSSEYFVNILPTGNFINSDKRFYSPSESLNINSSFNLSNNDSLTNCKIILENNGSESVLGNGIITGNNCSASGISLSGISDNAYSIYIKINESSESNQVKSLSNSIFICSQTTSGICGYADFDGNNKSDSCISGVITSVSGSGSSSGGGSGVSTIKEKEIQKTKEEKTQKIKLDKQEIRLDAYRKELKKVNITIENLKDEKSEIILSSDLGFIFFPKKVKLNPLEKKSITLWIYSPDKEEIYFGNLSLNLGDRKEIKVPIILSVQGFSELDIQTKIHSSFKIVRVGREVLANINLESLSDIDRAIFLEYYLREGDKIISYHKEIINIGKDEKIKLKRRVNVPESLDEGNYKFYADVSYEDVTISDSDSFFVRGRLSERQISIILIIISIFVLGWTIWYIYLGKKKTLIMRLLKRFLRNKYTK